MDNLKYVSLEFKEKPIKKTELEENVEKVLNVASEDLTEIINGRNSTEAELIAAIKEKKFEITVEKTRYWFKNEIDKLLSENAKFTKEEFNKENQAHLKNVEEEIRKDVNFFFKVGFKEVLLNPT